MKEENEEIKKKVFEKVKTKEKEVWKAIGNREAKDWEKYEQIHYGRLIEYAIDLAIQEQRKKDEEEYIKLENELNGQLMKHYEEALKEQKQQTDKWWIKNIEKNFKRYDYSGYVENKIKNNILIQEEDWEALKNKAKEMR